MSYTVELVINTGKKQVTIPDTWTNYTDNVGLMLRKAFACEEGINMLHEMPADTCAEHLKMAIAHMESLPSLYRLMNPENGWGSYEGCIKWLSEILSNCEQHPVSIPIVS